MIGLTNNGQVKCSFMLDIRSVQVKQPFCLDHRVTLIIILVLLLTTSTKSLAESPDYGPDAVWEPDATAAQALYDCALDPACELTALMEAHGASPTAIVFAMERDGWEYLSRFAELGEVDLGEIHRPFAANDVLGYEMLNGMPAAVSAQATEVTDLATAPVYTALLAQYPGLSLWPVNPALFAIQTTPNGGQQFQFAYRLTTGCNACEVVGYALVAFDFDTQGQFLGLTHLPPLPMDHRFQPTGWPAVASTTSEAPVPRQIAYISPTNSQARGQGTIWLIDETSSNPQQLTIEDVACCLSWSSDGQQLYYLRNADTGPFVSGPTSIVERNISTGVERVIGPTTETLGSSLAVSPDGRLLAYIINRPMPEGSLSVVDNIACLNLLDLTTNETLEINCQEQVYIGGQDFAPDGQSLLVTVGGFEWAAVATFGLSPSPPNYDEGICCESPEFTIDGSGIFTIGNEYLMFNTFQQLGRSGFAIFQYGQGTREPVPLLFSDDVLGWLELSPEGDRLLYSRGATIEILDLSTRGTQTVANGEGAVWRPGANTQFIHELPDLIKRKRDTFHKLEETFYTTTGGIIWPEPIPALSEQASRKLVTWLESAGTTATPQQQAAFERLVLQQETLVTLLEHYTSLVNDQADVAADIAALWVGTGLLAAKGTTNPQWALTDLAHKAVEDFVKLWLNIIEDENLRDATRNGLDVTLLYLDVSDVDPVAVGEVFLERAVEHQRRAEIAAELIPVFVDDLQPTIDSRVQAVLNESEALQSIGGESEGAELQLENLISISGLMRDTAHHAYSEHLGQGLDMNELLKDLVDMASVGTKHPIPLLVSLYARLQQWLIDIAASSVLSGAMACTTEAAVQAGDFAFQPLQTVFQCKPPLPLDWEELITQIFTDADERKTSSIGKPAVRDEQQILADSDSVALAQYWAALGELRSQVSSSDPANVQVQAEAVLEAAAALSEEASLMLARLDLTEGDIAAESQFALGVVVTIVRLDAVIVMLASDSYLASPASADMVAFNAFLQKAQENASLLARLRRQLDLQDMATAGLPVVMNLLAQKSGVVGEKLVIPVTVGNAGSQAIDDGVLKLLRQGEVLLTMPIPVVEPDETAELFVSFIPDMIGTLPLRIEVTDGEASDYRSMNAIIAAGFEKETDSAEPVISADTESAIAVEDRVIVSSDRLLQLSLAAVLILGVLWLGLGVTVYQKRRKG